MKATGIVRNVDDLGRVVLPKELRKVFAINAGDPVEFYTDNGGVFIKKYDVAGDIEQVLDNLDMALRMKSFMLAPAQLYALQAKINEMRAVISDGNSEGGQVK